ncbi:hypothetical protein GQX74_005305 [Glossina fuscipes]|nr:hypothetical protein GQX74_005305 [Glossina fuscipes]
MNDSLQSQPWDVYSSVFHDFDQQFIYNEKECLQVMKLSSKMRLYFMFAMTKAANIFACFYCFSHNTENFVLQHDNREQIMSLSLSFHHLVKYENIKNANAKYEDCKPFGKGNSMNYGR